MKNLLIIGMLALYISASSQEFAPVNKNASPEAKKLLSYLYSNKGKKTLAGQHNYSPSMNQFNDTVKSITGMYPAVWGTDFMLLGPKSNGNEIVKEAINKYKQGYIVTIMWHVGRPMDNPPYGWKESIQGKVNDNEWKELTTPGTELNKRWEVQVDEIAGYLKQLCDANVPVLWRPYHEMNGVWFWWGNKKGPDGYQKLFKMMYDRFVNHHQLNNILWVWDANGPRDIPFDEAYSYKDFYPGADYVDVLATDVYNSDYETKDYNELLDLANGKIITLGECGELPKPEILHVQSQWAWFMVWADFIKNPNTPWRVKEIYNDPQVLTHDKVKF
jgi:mannan endo-1,4-beta-mannosidase